MQGEDVAQKTQLFCRMMIGGFPAWIATTVLVKVTWLQQNDCRNLEMPLSGTCEPTWVCVQLHERLVHCTSCSWHERNGLSTGTLLACASRKVMPHCPLPAFFWGSLNIAAPHSVAAWAVQVMQVQNKMWPPALTTCEASLPAAAALLGHL